MAVSLDLQVSLSATLTNQGAGQPDTYAITPMFTLTPVAPVAQSQVQVKGVDGQVSSIHSGSNGLSLMIDYGFNNPSYPDGSTFAVATNASTVCPTQSRWNNGLIFNDSGAARMVCWQVNDGVAE